MENLVQQKKLRGLIKSKRREHAVYNISHSDVDKKEFNVSGMIVLRSTGYTAKIIYVK